MTFRSFLSQSVAVVAGLALLAAFGPIPARADTCGGPETPCVVADGSYHVVLPWEDGAPDGKRAALIFFHGWQQSGLLVMNNQALVDEVTSRNVVLIAPNGRNRTWAHVGSPSSARDDLAFTASVRADIIMRFGIDPDHIYVSGFSQGGSMAWDVACYQGTDYAAFLPVAGAFWRPLPDACPSQATVRHIHGTSDTVVPMAGRPIGDNGQWHQGDVLLGVDRLLAANACSADAFMSQTTDGLSCETWSACAAGTTIELCLHDGGHNFRADWVGDGLDWAFGQD
ncbi:MAG: polyhydroxybutyrate depolymerase [Pseudomonadota bacterium]